MLHSSLVDGALENVQIFPSTGLQFQGFVPDLFHLKENRTEDAS